MLQVMIGNAKYQCSCVRYVSQDNIPLIVGLSVGLGLLVIIIIVIIVIIMYRRHQSKPAEHETMSEDPYQTYTEPEQEEHQYSRKLPSPDYIGDSDL